MTEPFPTLRTDRLILREFSMADAPVLYRLAQSREVARTMLRHPHPYEEGMAEEWIRGSRPMFESGKGTTFAVLQEVGTLIGTVSLYTKAPDGRAVLGGEGTGLLGFWIGVPYWSEGYATEAVAEVVRYGFEERGLLRIRANRFGSNAASGRVLRRVGMRHVGTRPNYYEKWGRDAWCPDLRCQGDEVPLEERGGVHLGYEPVLRHAEGHHPEEHVFVGESVGQHVAQPELVEEHDDHYDGHEVRRQATFLRRSVVTLKQALRREASGALRAAAETSPKIVQRGGRGWALKR